MKPLILAFKFRCNNCNNVFEGVGLPDESYGEFILRTRSGKVAYLNSFQDPSFDEVKNLFQNFIKGKDTKKIKEPTIFQTILTEIFDPAADSSRYEIGLFPTCIKCGVNEKLSWEEVKPLRVTSEEVKPVAHETWDKLSIEEKKILIENAITEYLAKHA